MALESLRVQWEGLKSCHHELGLIYIYMDHNVSAMYVSVVSIGILIGRGFALMVI